MIDVGDLIMVKNDPEHISYTFPKENIFFVSEKGYLSNVEFIKITKDDVNHEFSDMMNFLFSGSVICALNERQRIFATPEIIIFKLINKNMEIRWIESEFLEKILKEYDRFFEIIKN